MNNEYAISINGLTKYYSNHLVLDEITFNVKKGSIHGLLGPNGAGKTTTLRSICSLQSFDRGEIKVFGNDLHESLPKIGFMLETPPLYNELTVREYLTFMGNIRGVKKTQIKSQIEFLVEKLKLDNIIDRYCFSLSRGQKQRVSIAQTLIHSPELIILDEPTLGLDPQTVVELRELLLGLKDKYTILISSHLLFEMDLLCDEVTILKHGKVKAHGDLKTLEDNFLSHKKVSFEVSALDESLIGELERKYANFSFSLEHGDTITGEMIVDTQYEVRPQLAKYLCDNNVELLSIKEEKKNLENLFMELTQ